MENSKILGGLQAAMRAEHEGYHFYMMASQNTEDAKAKEIFLQLANEEMEHLNFLRRQYESVSSSGNPDENVSLGNPLILSGPNPIFSSEFKSRIQSAHYEMTVLSVAAQLELDASRTYLKFSQEAADPVIKQFFKELSDWEQLHYRALVDQQEVLKDDYWTSNNFAPF